MESQATTEWNGILGRYPRRRRLDRTDANVLHRPLPLLLFPNVVSDSNGQYAGADGMVHQSTTRTQYANFSEWDIYRSEIELVSLLAPDQAGDMVQSLVNDAEQGGWLPKWAIVGGDRGR